MESTNKHSAATLNAEILINGSPAEVWAVVGHNFDKIMDYSPDVHRSFYLDRKIGMVGSQRRSEMHNGRTLDVMITEWDEERTVSWEIVKAHIPILKSGSSSYSLIPEGNLTRLVLNGDFKTVFFLLNPIAKRKFKQVVAVDMAGIKHLVETGESVGCDNVTQIVNRYKSELNFR